MCEIIFCAPGPAACCKITSSCKTQAQTSIGSKKCVILGDLTDGNHNKLKPDKGVHAHIMIPASTRYLHADQHPSGFSGGGTRSRSSTDTYCWRVHWLAWELGRRCGHWPNMTQLVSTTLWKHVPISWDSGLNLLASYGWCYAARTQWVSSGIAAPSSSCP